MNRGRLSRFVLVGKDRELTKWTCRWINSHLPNIEVVVVKWLSTWVDMWRLWVWAQLQLDTHVFLRDIHVHLPHLTHGALIRAISNKYLHVIIGKNFCKRERVVSIHVQKSIIPWHQSWWKYHWCVYKSAHDKPVGLSRNTP